MSSAGDFRAPWSVWLKVSSLVVVTVLIWASVYVVLTLPSRWSWTIPVVAYIAGGPLLLVLFALFMIRGYSLTPRGLIAHRLLWETSLPMTGLKSIHADPHAMRGSIRLFGNGGALSITGFFINRRLGRYRAFATDPVRALVLEFKSRKVVVTPDDPGRFISEAHKLFPALAEPEEPPNRRIQPTTRYARDG